MVSKKNVPVGRSGNQPNTNNPQQPNQTPDQDTDTPQVPGILKDYGFDIKGTWKLMKRYVEEDVEDFEMRINPIEGVNNEYNVTFEDKPAAKLKFPGETVTNAKLVQLKKVNKEGTPVVKAQHIPIEAITGDYFVYDDQGTFHGILFRSNSNHFPQIYKDNIDVLCLGTDRYVLDKSICEDELLMDCALWDDEFDGSVESKRPRWIMDFCFNRIK